MNLDRLATTTPVAAASPAGVVAVAAGLMAFAAIFVIAIIAHRPRIRRPAARPLIPLESVSGAGHRRRVAVIALVAVAAVVAVVAAGLIGAAIVGLAALAVPRLRRRRAADRARLDVLRSMPDAVELFVLCVHAGRSPTQAIAELAATAPVPVRPAFAAVELQLHRGRTLTDALAELAHHAGGAGRELATAVATADREGLPLGPVLDRLAADARAQRRRSGEAAARRLPVQLSFPLVACTLPSFVLLSIAPAVLGALSTLRGRAP
ncbi:MAG: type II secretion system F family protein [Ilumatobacteraceae bacterium]